MLPNNVLASRLNFVLVYCRHLNKLPISRIRLYTKNSNVQPLLNAKNAKDKRILAYNLIPKRLVTSDPKKIPYVVKVMYASMFGLGLSIGLFLGFMYNLDARFRLRGKDAILILLAPNQMPINYSLIKRFEYPNSNYNLFPLKITLYQYETDPYCAQIRAYLDFFGFSYEVIEVDPYAKIEGRPFTKQSNIPVCILEDKYTNRKWFLADAATIISALESLRNENYRDFYNILPKYQPVFMDGEISDELRFPHRYLVSPNSDLNDMLARKWIENRVVPTFKWNATDSYKHCFEAVKEYSKKSQWDQRFGKLKQWYLYYMMAYRLHAERNNYKDEIENLDTYTNPKPLTLLDDIITSWENSISKDEKLPFLGSNGPNLADLSMFGAIVSYEGTSFFKHVMKSHPKFANWYIHMQEHVLTNQGGAPSPGILDWLESKMLNEGQVEEKAKGITGKIIEGASNIAEKAKEGVGLITQKAKQKTHEAMDTISSEYEEIREKAHEFIGAGKEKTREAKDKASTKTDELIDMTKQKGGEAAARAREMKERAEHKTEGLIDTTKRKAGEAYDVAKEKAKETKDKATQKGDELVGGVKKATDETFGKARDVKEKAYEKSDEIIDKTKRKAGEAYDVTKDTVRAAKDTIVDKSGELVDKTKQKASEAYDVTKDTTKAAKDTIVGKTEEVVDKTKKKVGEAYDATVGMVKSAKDTVVGTTGKAVDFTKRAAEDTYEDAKERLKGAKESAGETAEAFVDNTKKFSGDTYGKMSEKTGEMIDVGKEKVVEAAGAVREKAKGAEEYMLDEANLMLGKGFEGIEKAAEKVTGAYKDVKGKTQEMIKEIKDVARDESAYISEKVRETADKAKEGVGMMTGKVNETISEAEMKGRKDAQMVKDKARDLKEKAGEKYEDLKGKVIGEGDFLKKKAGEVGEKMGEKVEEGKREAKKFFADETSVTKEVHVVERPGEEEFVDLHSKGAGQNLIVDMENEGKVGLGHLAGQFFEKSSEAKFKARQKARELDERSR